LNRTLAEIGRPPLAREDVEALIGRGVRSLLERALGDSTGIDEAVKRFEGHYRETVATTAPLFPGVIEGLGALRSGGIVMSVVTNKPRFFTLRLLQRTGILASFVGVVAGDDGLPRKPAPEMLLEAARKMGVPIAESLMIGDSANDVAAARAAGCPVWCVPYGYNEGRGVETLRCDRIVTTLGEAARLLGG
jgi:phosphoglycolate phosphatase